MLLGRSQNRFTMFLYPVCMQSPLKVLIQEVNITISVQKGAQRQESVGIVHAVSLKMCVFGAKD